MFGAFATLKNAPAKQSKLVKKNITPQRKIIRAFPDETHVMIHVGNMWGGIIRV